MPRSGPSAAPVDRDVDQLFALPLGDFVAARNALATRLKKEGRGDESARVKGLTRPSISAWAVNQVFWRERPAYDRLIAAGDALRAAQQRMLTGRQADLRDAMRDRQAAARAVVEHAMRFLRESGNAATEATRQRVAVTVDALAAYGSDAHAYTPGRLERDLDPPGLEALSFLSGLAPAAQGATGGRDRATPSGGRNLRLVQGGTARAPTPADEDPKAARARAAAERAERERLDRERREREREQRAARAAAEREVAAATRAFERAVQAEREAAALHHEQARSTESLRRQLAAAEERLNVAASELETARLARERAETALAHARERREALPS